MNYVGIDPGKTGALARLFPDAVEDCPSDGLGICRILQVWQLQSDLNLTVIIEKAQAMPKQGTVSMFNYGMGYGVYLGILQAYGIRFIEVPPQRWKKEFGLIGKGKDASILEARKLFPALGVEICLKKHHGRAEALLLAEWGRRHNL